MYLKHFSSYKGMSSLYSITVLTAIRCTSVVKYDNSWYVVTSDRFMTSGWVQMIWTISIMISLPPLIGFGEFAVDVGMIK